MGDDDDDDSVVDHLNKDTTMVIKLMRVIEKQQACLIKKNEEIKDLADEHKKLKGYNSSLIMRYEQLENEFACATNSIACVASLKKENQELKSQLEEITSKLEIANKVMFATVKSYEPHVQVDLTCANTCCSKANISPSTTCDLDCVGKREKHMDHGLMGNAQPSQDNHESMVKKLEKGSTVACTKFYQENKSNNKSKGQIQSRIKNLITCFMCKKVGHYALMCSNKIDEQATLPKRRTRRSNRKCYGCNEKGHEVASCFHMKDDFVSSRKKLNSRVASKMQDVVKKAPCCITFS
ncbi:hypothetical protein OsJ_17677 [Oryza sativa Japonica Group]|uniref:CCHC-type domain-containing protein n=1 Tax=Oryza sativa subsp. japonica TaxID=39947 RepID=B9FNB3_ORYSJ|nr:hypothetical protein OsJ_17677 [Oryza sativa Japonica Group]